MSPKSEKASRSQKPLVILDRDGVINHDSDAYIKSAQEWHPITGSLEAIARLTEAGFDVAIATNQRGIALGLYDHLALEEMHHKLHTLLAPLGGRISQIEYCTADDTEHPNRKPNPGMLLTIAKAHGYQKAQYPTIYFVGDKHSDLIAAKRADMQPILVKSGKGSATAETIAEDPHYRHTPIYNDLAEFVTHLLKEDV